MDTEEPIRSVRYLPNAQAEQCCLGSGPILSTSSTPYSCRTKVQGHKKQSTRTGCPGSLAVVECSPGLRPATNRAQTTTGPAGGGSAMQEVWSPVLSGLAATRRLHLHLTAWHRISSQRSRSRAAGPALPLPLPHGCCCLLPRENKTRGRRVTRRQIGGPFLL